MIGIYKITSPSGKIYIGQSWAIENRIKDYKYISPSQSILYASFQKHGIENHIFDIIFVMPDTSTQEHLNYAETFFWRLEILQGNKMLNGREPGSRGRLSPESIKKMSNSLKGRTSWNKGLKLSPLSEDHKNKISNSHIGKNHEHGHLHSPEVRKKASLKCIGQKRTPDQIKRMKEGRSTKLNIDSVKAIRSKFKPYEYTLKMLAEEYLVSIQTIKCILNNKTWKDIC